MSREIVFKIRNDGTVVVDAIGFTGEACVEATRKVIEALGLLEEEHNKPERFEYVAEGIGIQDLS